MLKKFIKDKWGILIQFIKFGIVGLSNTCISYVVYVVLVRLGFVYLLANVFGFIISVLNAFYWNNKYVFAKNEGEKRSWVKALLKVFASYSITGLLLTTILLEIWIKYVGISEYIAPIINLIITIPLNFLLNKLWAFKEKK